MQIQNFSNRKSLRNFYLENYTTSMLLQSWNELGLPVNDRARWFRHFRACSYGVVQLYGGVC